MGGDKWDMDALLGALDEEVDVDAPSKLKTLMKDAPSAFGGLSPEETAEVLKAVLEKGGYKPPPPATSSVLPETTLTSKILDEAKATLTSAARGRSDLHNEKQKKLCEKNPELAAKLSVIKRYLRDAIVDSRTSENEHVFDLDSPQRLTVGLLPIHGEDALAEESDYKAGRAQIVWRYLHAAQRLVKNNELHGEIVEYKVHPYLGGEPFVLIDAYMNAKAQDIICVFMETVTDGSLRTSTYNEIVEIPMKVALEQLNGFREFTLTMKEDMDDKEAEASLKATMNIIQMEANKEHGSW